MSDLKFNIMAVVSFGILFFSPLIVASEYFTHQWAQKKDTNYNLIGLISPNTLSYSVYLFSETEDEFTMLDAECFEADPFPVCYLTIDAQGKVSGMQGDSIAFSPPVVTIRVPANEGEDAIILTVETDCCDNGCHP